MKPGFFPPLIAANLADTGLISPDADPRNVTPPTFEMRRTSWPPELNPPPVDWETPWLGFITDYPLPWRTAGQGYEALKSFLAPIIEGHLGGSPEWDPETWSWKHPPYDGA